MSLEPENTGETPETAVVPDGLIERREGETELEFGRRADRLRLAHLRKKAELMDASTAVDWRSHMTRCYSVPLGHRSSAHRAAAERNGTGTS